MCLFPAANNSLGSQVLDSKWVQKLAFQEFAAAGSYLYNRMGETAVWRSSSSAGNSKKKYRTGDQFIKKSAVKAIYKSSEKEGG